MPNQTLGPIQLGQCERSSCTQVCTISAVPRPHWRGAATSKLCRGSLSHDVKQHFVATFKRCHFARLPLRNTRPKWSPQLCGNANSAGPHWIMWRIPVSKVNKLFVHGFWFSWPCVKSSLTKRKRTESSNPSTDLDLSKWNMNHFNSILNPFQKTCRWKL